MLICMKFTLQIYGMNVEKLEAEDQKTGEKHETESTEKRKEKKCKGQSATWSE